MSYTVANPLQFENEALYLVEGTLSELEIAPTTVNLLAQIEKNVKAKSAAAGAAAALSGMHGVVANSAAIALYDGEDTYNFAALLDDQVVCGTFQHADKIRDGDRVKAVVSKRGEVLFVHAVMNAKTDEFYMPLNIFSSSDGLFWHCMRVASGFTIFLWIFLPIIFYIVGAFDSETIATKDQLILAFLIFLFPPALMFPFEYWTYRSMRSSKSEGGDTYGSAIFKVFGFPKADKIDLMGDSTLSDGTNGGWYAAWRSDKLLKKLSKA